MLHDDKPPLNEAILEHYGVKGMHWGVRKQGSGSGLLPGARSSMAVGSKIGKKVYDYKHAPDASGVSRKQARSTVKTQNRSLRRELEDFNDLPSSKRDSVIHEARKSLKSSTRKYEDVRRDIKSQRSVMGKNAARVALNKVANEHASVLSKAKAQTHTEELLKAFTDIGRSIMQDMSASSVRSRQQAASARTRPYTPRQPYRTTSQRVG